MRKYDTLNSDIIRKINEEQKKNPNQKLVIQIPNTKGISSKMLKELDPNVSIRIEGAYDSDLISRKGNDKYSNGETGEYYTTAVIYTRNEAIQIVSEMEKIEEGLKGQDFSQLEKLVYIYERLKSSVMYDPKFESKPSKDTRSLRGLITKQTVCAGYAVIFKEMMDRQGIECRYVSGRARNGGRTCMEYCNTCWKTLSNRFNLG